MTATLSRIPIFSNRSEIILLTLSGLFILLGMLSMAIYRGEFPTFWMIFVVWLICALAGMRVLNRYLPVRDRFLFPLVMFLSGWGLVLIERLAPIFADRQAIWLALSVPAMLLVAILPQPLRWLRTYRYTLLVIALVMLASTIILGRNPSGFTSAPQLWVGIGSLYFQPSEAMKLIIVAFLASYLGEQYPMLRPTTAIDKRTRPALSPRLIGPTLLMWGLSIVVLIWQRDLGTATLFFMVFILLLYIASGDLRIVIGGIVLVSLAAVVAYQLFDVVRLRIDIWLNPWADPGGRAYQIVQSLMAFGEGGIFGTGVAQGSPTYIPVVHSDFVFSALAEEWGLLGVIVVLSLFATLVLRGLRIAIEHNGRPFHILLAVGLTMMLAVQALLIMSGVLKLMPLTGVTLPFMSYGGSSLLVSYIMIGLLLRLSSGER